MMMVMRFPCPYLLGIHYVFHKDDPDFDNGLALLDALWAKLHSPFRLDWNVVDMKDRIRNSDDPQEAYKSLLGSILTNQMIAYYGL
jgi:hypothetical protein